MPTSPVCADVLLGDSSAASIGGSTNRAAPGHIPAGHAAGPGTISGTSPGGVNVA